MFTVAGKMFLAIFVCAIVWFSPFGIWWIIEKYKLDAAKAWLTTQPFGFYNSALAFYSFVAVFVFMLVPSYVFSFTSSTTKAPVPMAELISRMTKTFQSSEGPVDFFKKSENIYAMAYNFDFAKKHAKRNDAPEPNTVFFLKFDPKHNTVLASNFGVSENTSIRLLAPQFISLYSLSFRQGLWLNSGMLEVGAEHMPWRPNPDGSLQFDPKQFNFSTYDMFQSVLVMANEAGWMVKADAPSPIMGFLVSLAVGLIVFAGFAPLLRAFGVDTTNF